MPRVRVQLDTPSGLLTLPSGSYVIGRGEDCDITLDSGRASRRHARLVVTPTGATLEDLTSVNGTFVNGAQVSGSRELSHLDFIVIGDVALEITLETIGATDPEVEWPAPTTESRERMPSQRLPTTPARAYETLEGTADHFFAAGQSALAERTLEGWLSRVKSALEADLPRDTEGDSAALRCGIKLVVATGATRWVDYCLELSALLGTPLAASHELAIDRVIAQAGASPSALEAYLRCLQAQPATAEVSRALARARSWREQVRQP